MVNVNELRLGNWLQFEINGVSHLGKVAGIYKRNISFESNIKADKKICFPISFNKESLRLFGLREAQDKKWYYDGPGGTYLSFEFLQHEKGLWLTVSSFNCLIIAIDTYLHVFQNLLYTLTSQELKISAKHLQ